MEATAPDTITQLLSEIFQEIDTKDEGTISREQFRSLLEALGKSVSDAEYEDIIKRVDCDNTGSVEKEEFVAFMMTDYKDFVHGVEEEEEDSDFINSTRYSLFGDAKSISVKHLIDNVCKLERDYVDSETVKKLLMKSVAPSRTLQTLSVADYKSICQEAILEGKIDKAFKGLLTAQARYAKSHDDIAPVIEKEKEVEPNKSVSAWERIFKRETTPPSIKLEQKNVQSRVIHDLVDALEDKKTIETTTADRFKQLITEKSYTESQFRALILKAFKKEDPWLSSLLTKIYSARQCKEE
jgi:Ca2+-binding EF-hand superfamily protein